MFDTMTMTKIVGGVGSALLIFLLGTWAADELYSTGSGGHGETASADGTQSEGHSEEAAVEEGPSFEELYASADVAAGEKVFKKCKACHKLEAAANATGPTLFGVVGRDVAKADGFSYSGAMVELGGAWTPERMNEFLTKPKDMVPGTKMVFTGLKKPEQRANLIAYLAANGS